MSTHRFSQVDVFASGPISGNPVAVVHDADDLSEAQMAAFARWTNLSETTFLSRAGDPRADYRLRIFTPGGELPFAGHPTLGSAHAWLAANAAGTRQGLIQECGLGLIELRIAADGSLAFAAPGFVRTGSPNGTELAHALDVLGIADEDVLDAQWIDNGPGWLGLWLRDAATVLDVEPDFARFAGSALGVLGAYPPVAETGAGQPVADVEVRAFLPDGGVPEDPVTGSLCAGFARWLVPSGRLPEHYTVSQGTRLGRAGRVTIDRDADGTIWVGGRAVTTVSGTVEL
ncbi:PhzF family phenazine biosynthesis protein [Brevibacterium sp. 50QC2O2]|uniref:PhzF family phenazine biosynthesis protein n=1 Tax=Brevibacterium TaxID=1696 RepID=UPI00211C80D1|nr:MULTISPECIES: PhzF family phenazine biosynthesis protein [unclassified Brevibacterium]MCQ9366756.1 PhzF family phenazine biosynthesis protein [Brevibacterium sp. 91QC2O2]MCQ9384272.1 PhzF family phenazine biosynthesis protein [Brevibacterium sp. 68QC2CO]MCQ9388891.1 PhzF family phenazine biosynthesis protein [Brevibacterium sp. 50QC2O2]